MELQKELQEIIQEFDITLITKIEEIDDIYDYELMIKTNDLVIRENKDEEINIILFDTNVYNSTYLLDVFKEYCDENGELFSHVKVFYCDTLSIYKTLFEKYWRKSEQIEDFVLDYIKPVILVINGFDDEILIETETISPISVRQFERLLEELN
jgi:hypothetical protein